MGHLLTTTERLRFVEYCKSQAESCRLMAEQMGKLGAHPAAEELMKREKAKAAAYSIVAIDLSSMTEEHALGPEDVGALTSEKKE